ncbi:hypothetical protein HELRODRAFT_166330 [Helobdella robusta]|uniref:Uncharacterized protein n=1 Tax=Helobdella robusta TaxID=6412 RepID=T1EY11_HELRO|nr:hypothetical protein HELRODRAFT_166330 [Helobdella robusta]ESN90631.1 hypothetical protein HELRODRAFT_166330 [Helobdella robusta]
MCFAALSVVSLVTVVVSIQLLRLGLVNETTDGHTFQKENKDHVIVVALTVASLEGVFCVISAFISCRLASKAKKELQSKREGTFHVRIMGEKDIVLVSKQAPDGTEKREKVFATSI